MSRPERRGLTWRAGFRLALALALAAALPFRAEGHSPDTSYLRCRVEEHLLELRFTFDLATVFRIVHADANNDGKVDRAEMEAAAAEVFRYLADFVRLEINGHARPLEPHEPFAWPADAGNAIAEKDYNQSLCHFPIRISSEPLIEDFTVTYDVFDELGDRHRAIADIEQGGRHLEVVFTMFEPDYLYDTFWKPMDAAAPPPRQNSGHPTRMGFVTAVARVWDSRVLPVLIAFILLARKRLPNSVLAVAIAGMAVVVGLILTQADLMAASREGGMARMTGVMAGLFTGVGMLFLVLAPICLAVRNWWARQTKQG